MQSFRQFRRVHTFSSTTVTSEYTAALRRYCQSIVRRLKNEFEISFCAMNFSWKVENIALTASLSASLISNGISNTESSKTACFFMKPAAEHEQWQRSTPPSYSTTAILLNTFICKPIHQPHALFKAFLLPLEERLLPFFPFFPSFLLCFSSLPCTFSN